MENNGEQRVELHRVYVVVEKMCEEITELKKQVKTLTGQLTKGQGDKMVTADNETAEGNGVKYKLYIGREDKGEIIYELFEDYDEKLKALEVLILTKEKHKQLRIATGGIETNYISIRQALSEYTRLSNELTTTEETPIKNVPRYFLYIGEEQEDGKISYGFFMDYNDKFEALGEFLTLKEKHKQLEVEVDREVVDNISIGDALEGYAELYHEKKMNQKLVGNIKNKTKGMDIMQDNLENKVGKVPLEEQVLQLACELSSLTEYITQTVRHLNLQGIEVPKTLLDEDDATYQLVIGKRIQGKVEFATFKEYEDKLEAIRTLHELKEKYSYVEEIIDGKVMRRYTIESTKYRYKFADIPTV